MSEKYTSLARLFTYPDRGFREDVRRLQDELARLHEPAARELLPFTSFVEASPVEKLQELYLRTFEVQALATLDIGYLLFGEDYRRGALLAHLGRELRVAGVDLRGELPDHLPNVLRLLSSMEDREMASELAMRILGPALRRLLQEFDPQRVKRKDELHEEHDKTLIERPGQNGTVYVHALRALYAVLEEEFDLGADESEHFSSDFIGSVSRELEMERRERR